MALEPGPDKRVRTPGARDNDESSDVANVNVTNTSSGVVPGARDESLGGRRGSRLNAADGENTSFSDISLDCVNSLSFFVLRSGD